MEEKIYEIHYKLRIGVEFLLEREREKKKRERERAPFWEVVLVLFIVLVYQREHKSESFFILQTNWRWRENFLCFILSLFLCFPFFFSSFF